MTCKYASLIQDFAIFKRALVQISAFGKQANPN